MVLRCFNTSQASIQNETLLSLPFHTGIPIRFHNNARSKRNLNKNLRTTVPFFLQHDKIFQEKRNTCTHMSLPMHMEPRHIYKASDVTHRHHSWRAVNKFFVRPRENNRGTSLVDKFLTSIRIYFCNSQNFVLCGCRCKPRSWVDLFLCSQRHTEHFTQPDTCPRSIDAKASIFWHADTLQH